MLKSPVDLPVEVNKIKESKIRIVGLIKLSLRIVGYELLNIYS